MLLHIVQWKSVVFKKNLFVIIIIIWNQPNKMKYKVFLKVFF